MSLGCFQVLRYWCFAFRGAGQHNYAWECAEVLLKWKYEIDEDLRKVLERAWFFNRWGKEGQWIAADLYLEQLNFWVKVRLDSYYSKTNLTQRRSVYSLHKAVV